MIPKLALSSTPTGTLRRDCWVPALDNTTGSPRDDADVADITALMQGRSNAAAGPAT
jgi:hypothetical protein